MLVAAQKCTVLSSRWISLAILMCDNTLSLLFKDGACINYPGSNAAMYYGIVAAPSPGHWLWQNLYRILPYRRIPLPCPPAGCGVVTPCSEPHPISENLHFTVTGSGACDGSYPARYAGFESWNYTGGTLGSCTATEAAMSLVCGGATWGFSTATSFTTYTPASVSYSPLSIVFTGVDFSGCGGATGATVTVTT
jgi:hypothetical protein